LKFWPVLTQKTHFSLTIRFFTVFPYCATSPTRTTSTITGKSTAKVWRRVWTTNVRILRGLFWWEMWIWVIVEGLWCRMRTPQQTVLIFLLKSMTLGVDLEIWFSVEGVFLLCLFWAPDFEWESFIKLFYFSIRVVVFFRNKAFCYPVIFVHSKPITTVLAYSGLLKFISKKASQLKLLIEFVKFIFLILSFLGMILRDLELSFWSL